MTDTEKNTQETFTGEDTYAHLTADVLARMEKSWSAEVVARTAIEEFSGGLLTKKHMQNLDSQRQGPPVKIRFQRKIAYPKKELISWLSERVRAC